MNFIHSCLTKIQNKVQTISKLVHILSLDLIVLNQFYNKNLHLLYLHLVILYHGEQNLHKMNLHLMNQT